MAEYILIKKSAGLSRDYSRARNKEEEVMGLGLIIVGIGFLVMGFSVIRKS